MALGYLENMSCECQLCPNSCFPVMFLIQYEASALCSYLEPFFLSMYGLYKIIAIKTKIKS